MFRVPLRRKQTRPTMQVSSTHFGESQAPSRAKPRANLWAAQLAARGDARRGQSVDET